MGDFVGDLPHCETGAGPVFPGGSAGAGAKMELFPNKCYTKGASQGACLRAARAALPDTPKTAQAGRSGLRNITSFMLHKNSGCDLNQISGRLPLSYGDKFAPERDPDTADYAELELPVILRRPIPVGSAGGSLSLAADQWPSGGPRPQRSGTPPRPPSAPSI